MLFKYITIGLITIFSQQVLGQEAAQDEPCLKEVEKLCGEKRSPDCLSKARERLSIACKVKLQNVDTLSKNLGSSGCMKDIQKFCPVSSEAFEKGGADYISKQAACVKNSESKFSKSCKAYLHKVRMGSLGG